MYEPSSHEPFGHEVCNAMFLALVRIQNRVVLVCVLVVCSKFNREKNVFDTVDTEKNNEKPGNRFLLVTRPEGTALLFDLY